MFIYYVLKFVMLVIFYGNLCFEFIFMSWRYFDILYHIYALVYGSFCTLRFLFVHSVLILLSLYLTVPFAGVLPIIRTVFTSRADSFN